MEKIIIDVLNKKVSPYLIYLFGSTVKGTEHDDSDIDIAFLSNKEVDKYETFIIAQELAYELKRDVDLINLNQANTVFQAQVVSTGKIIYCRDDHAKALFEMKVLKMYAKLNEERDPIITRIEESGTVYEK